MYQFTEHDYQVIDTLRTAFTSYHVKDYRFTHTDEGYFLNSWQDNKSKYLTKMFGDELILHKQISYTRSDDIILKELALILDGNFMGELSNAIEDAYYRTPFIDRTVTLYGERDGILRWLFNDQCFLDNRYNGPSVKLPIGNNTFTLTHGCRPCRALGKLAEYLGKQDEWEEVRIAISQTLNQRTLTGNLCLSIHPADYLTASLNDCGWESCMNLRDGCYRAGVLEMMNSPCVVVAYLTAKNDMEIEDSGVFWNNKKWREFFIVDADVISGIKGYPYWNRELEDIVINWIRNLVITNDVFPNSSFNFIDAMNLDYSSNSSIIFRCGPAMYNDFYSTHHMCLNNNANFVHSSWKKLTLNYSQPATCINCGRNIVENDAYNKDAESICCCYCDD